MHFLILFIGFTVLFQLSFSLIYRTFSKKNLVSAKLVVPKQTLPVFFIINFVTKISTNAIVSYFSFLLLSHKKACMALSLICILVNILQDFPTVCSRLKTKNKKKRRENLKREERNVFLLQFLQTA